MGLDQARLRGGQPHPRRHHQGDAGSKVVGDLAQFMVDDLTEAQVLEQAKTVVPLERGGAARGRSANPLGGFPEPFRSDVLRGRAPIEEPAGREPPGARPRRAPPRSRGRAPARQHPRRRRDERRPLPRGVQEYRKHRTPSSATCHLPTRVFLAPLEVGDEIGVEIERGKTLIITLKAVGSLDATGHRTVFFELNGQPRQVRVRDRGATATVKERERATDAPGSVGAPMPGSVVDVAVAVGSTVAKGDPLVVLSAMKMETVVASPVAGTIARVAVKTGETLAAGDLLVEVDVAEDEAA
ncbi:MAG: biotin/lipoyl-containing protein [Sandaracinaceae bacterium]